MKHTEERMANQAKTIEMFQKECRRLSSINAELLEACKEALKQFEIEGKGLYDYSEIINPLKKAINRAEGREEK